MTRSMFTVTYDVVTPESAECGDFAESGFLDRHGNRVAAVIGGPTPDVNMTLREALVLASPQQDSGNWFSEIDGKDDYCTGANETRSIHPPRNVTRASYKRLARLMGVR